MAVDKDQFAICFGGGLEDALRDIGRVDDQGRGFDLRRLGAIKNMLQKILPGLLRYDIVVVVAGKGIGRSQPVKSHGSGKRLPEPFLLRSRLK